MMVPATSAPKASRGIDKNRFVFEHVWKTGGTELCRLARAHGWHVPAAPGCTLPLQQHGWPKEDYDMFGIESVLYNDGPKADFVPKRPNEDAWEVHDVRWISIVRHPYSRSLSHFYHVHSNLLQLNRSITMEEFFRGHGGAGLFGPAFDTFIRDQQTRWHCGWACSLAPKLRREHLQKAMNALNQFHVVLILEDMQDPDSCTRRQMKHVLNFTNVLADFVQKHQHQDQQHPQQRLSNNSILRRPGTRWDDQVHPYLTPQGRHVNNSMWGNESVVMAELGIHNEMDLQFYGYAQQRCEELASHIPIESKVERRTMSDTPSSYLVLPKSCLPNYYPWFLAVVSLVVLVQLRILGRIRSRIPWKEN